MFHIKVFLAIGATFLLMMLSPFAYSEVSIGNDYPLNAEVQGLLADGSSSGICFSKVTLFSKQIEQKHFVFPIPTSKPEVKWVHVVCEADVTPNFLYWLEIRLSHVGILDKQDIFTEGMKVGLDSRLYRAIEKFQLLRGLAVSGLSYETINVLSGLDISGDPKILDAH